MSLKKKSDQIVQPYAQSDRCTSSSAVSSECHRSSSPGSSACHRQAAYEAGQKLGRMFKKRKVSQKTAKTRPSGRSGYGGGNDLTTFKTRTTSRKKMPSQKSMMSQMMKAVMPTYVYRYQNLTNYDTNLGAQSLWNHNTDNEVNNPVDMPIHIYDLSSIPNTPGQVFAGCRFSWAGQSRLSDVKRVILSGQAPDGSDDQSGKWHNTDSKSNDPLQAQQVFHKWTEVRLNLYGPRKRSTWFEVMFIKVTDELAHPFHASDSNYEKKMLMQYLERPCIWSNLQTDA